MAWLTSLPAGVLVVGWLAFALLVAIGSRLAVRALIPTAERDGAYTIAAPAGVRFPPDRGGIGYKE